jgi:type IV secretory pathway TraG/TraD family ATPase VirD4
MALEEFNRPREPLVSPSQEVEFLRTEVRDRERTLRGEGRAFERPLVAREVVKEYQDVTAQEVIDPSLAMKRSEIEGAVLHLSKSHEQGVETLANIMETKGIKNALEVLKKNGNPHLEDDFHRFLVQYLVENGTIAGLKEGTPLFKALHMKLFEIVLPRTDDTGKERRFSEIVSAMEQFYAGMLSVADPRENIKQHFTIELALSNYTEEMVLYSAVPAYKADMFQKHLFAIFPDARVTERREDYNPFNGEGVSVGATASFVASPLLPIKTYETFDTDPLNVVLNAFSKMKKDGEGAAIQLVIAPAGDAYNKSYQAALDKLKKGEKLKDVSASASATVAKEFLGTARDMFFGAKPTPKEDQKRIDENAVTLVAEKIATPIVAVNIRIVTSAETELRARSIMESISSAFNQFSNPNGNAFRFAPKTGKDIAPLLHEFSFRLFARDNSLMLNTKELTTIFHFPSVGVKSAELKYAKVKSSAAPRGAGGEGILLGVNAHQGQRSEIHFAPEDRMRHFYVIGQTGTGKTTLLKNMIVQDIQAGAGVCMIDPHGSDIDDILASIPPHRVDDVIYFDPASTQPMGLNMLEYDPSRPEQKTFVVNELLSIFQKLYASSPESMGPMFEQYFRNATMLVIEDPSTGSTLLEVSRVLSDAKFRALKLSRCHNPVVVQFWNEIASKSSGEAALANIVPYITNKFDVFLANDIMRPIIAQERSAFNFRQIMDERKIFLVNLAKGRIGDINSQLLGLILVGKILMASLSRVDTNERPDFYLYIDEFQNVTTDSIATILSEARKYRLGLNVAHQFIAQLADRIRDAVFGNVGSMAVFRVGSEDAQFLEKQFAPIFTASDIISLENRNAYMKMLVNGQPEPAFNIETLPPPKGDMMLADKLKEISALTYGRDRAEVEAEIAQKYQKTPPSAGI